MSLNITDSNIFENLNFVIRLLQQQHDLLLNRQLPLTTEPSLPFVFVCDEEFGLNKHWMWPYLLKYISKEHKIFNCQLSRAQRLV